ncbi:conserved hypothetical protein, partial CDS, partial [Candidatus Phytoplasma solani]
MGFNIYAKKRYIYFILMFLITLLFAIISAFNFFYVDNLTNESVSISQILKPEEKMICLDKKLEKPNLELEANSNFQLKNLEKSKDDIDQKIINEIKNFKKKGISVYELKQKGYTACQLKKAKFCAKQLKQGGFSIQELRLAEYQTKALKKAGYTPHEMIETGYTPKDLKNVYTPKELIELKLDNKIFQQIGYQAKDFKKHFVELSELEQNGYTIFNLIQIG